MSTRTRSLWLASAMFAVIASWLFAWHAAGERRIEATAERIDAGRPWSARELLLRDVAFAATELRNPTYDELPPGGVRAWYRWNPLHPGAADVLRWGSDYRGPCGSHTNVVIALLAARGVESRPLLLRSPEGEVLHTVVEARVGGRWVVADPSYGIVFRHPDGRLATAAEIAADTALFAAATRGVRGYTPAYDYRSVARLNWRKLPALYPGLQSLLGATIGSEQAAAITKPRILIEPQRAFGVLALLLAMTFALLAWAAARLPRRAPAVRAVRQRAATPELSPAGTARLQPVARERTRAGARSRTGSRSEREAPSC